MRLVLAAHGVNAADKLVHDQSERVVVFVSFLYGALMDLLELARLEGVQEWVDSGKTFSIMEEERWLAVKYFYFRASNAFHRVQVVE